MSARPLGFGIVGCGGIAAVHIAALAQVPDAVLAGVTDSDPGRARALAQGSGAQAFATLEDMLVSDEIDIVSILTPSGLHAPMALKALHAGKHVVVEKPLALTLDDADAVIALARAKQRKVCVISQLRFSPSVTAVKRALEAGALGRVVSVRLTMHYWRSPAYYASSPWRGTWAMDGGGALMNQGIHGVDLLLYLLGPVKRVSAITKTQTHAIHTEDSAAAVLEFASGCLGTLQASTTAYPGYARTLEICGDQGSVILREDDILSWDVPLERPQQDAKPGNAARDHRAVHPEGHRVQLTNMVRAVRGAAPLSMWTEPVNGGGAKPADGQKTPPPYVIRGMRRAEYPELQEFLYQAIHVPPGEQPPPRSALDHPDIALYTDGFGDQPHDHALVALAGDAIVGAVWARIMRDYGHVDDATPSLAISVLTDHRGRGIGTALLNAMLKLLRDRGYHQVSLSVQKDNRAVSMYTHAGFTVLRENAHDYIMVCAL